MLSFLFGRSIATPEGDQVSALFGRFAIGPTGYLGALGIAILIALMTAITSRLTVFPASGDDRMRTIRPFRRLTLLRVSLVEGREL